MILSILGIIIWWCPLCSKLQYLRLSPDTFWCTEVRPEHRERVSESMKMRGHRKIGRPKLRWSDVRRKGMKEKRVQREEEPQCRRRWWLKTLDAPTPNRDKAEEDQFVRDTYSECERGTETNILHLQLASERGEVVTQQRREDLYDRWQQWRH